MSAGIEKLLDAVDWRELPELDPPCDPDGLYATHEGVLEVGGASLKAYTLNDGRRILDAADVLRFFGEDPEAVLGANR